MELKRDVTAHDSFRSYVVADSIYVAEISSFANSALREEFAAWIDETRDAATAYILDVRGNSGGSDGNAIEVLRHFIAPADMGTRSVYKQYVDPTQVTTALGMKDHFEELEPGSDLEQYYQGGLDMYAHRYVVPYDKSLSAPEYANETEAAEAEVPAVRLCTQPVAVSNGLELRLCRRRLCCFREGCAQRDPDRHKHRRRHRTALIDRSFPEASVSPCRPTTASWRTVRRSATTAFSRISGASRRYQARLPGKMPFF